MPDRTAPDFITQLMALQDPARSNKAAPTFRCDEPEEFIAVRMRDVFDLARSFADLDIEQIDALLDSRIHEVRVGAVSIMDVQARSRAISEERREALFTLYLRRHDRINNWDLVDRAAPYVVGGYLLDKPRGDFYRLARSSSIWERRTAIVATSHFIRHHQLDDTFSIAAVLVEDGHDLVQKAVGGWVREAGRQDPARLRDFLNTHAGRMSSVMLRYAIEHLDPAERRHYRAMRSAANHAPR